MRSHTAENNTAKAANKVLAKMQHLMLKPCSANVRNLLAGPASVIAPQRNALTKTQTSSPWAKQKNPAWAKLVGIFLASQQNHAATTPQLVRKIM
jgi:hypothetical protein